MANPSDKRKWTAEEVQQWYRDTQSFVYCNPNDLNIVVKKPRREGLTVNWANPKAHLLQGAILAVVLAAVCLLFYGCAKSKPNTPDPDLYAGNIQDADVFIDIPTLRQYGSYTCGTTCVQMLMNWLDPYQADLNLATYETELGTTEEVGTPPESIAGYLEANNVSILAKASRTTQDLRDALDQGHPILLCLQAWGDSYNTQDPSDTDTYLAEGHWVLCVGYQRQKDGTVFYFNDPACVGHTLMREDDLDARWIDMDTAGNIYDHYGIEIAEAGTSYSPSGAFYLE